MQMTICDTFDCNWSERSLLINFELVNHERFFGQNLSLCRLIFERRNCKYQTLAALFGGSLLSDIFVAEKPENCA